MVKNLDNPHRGYSGEDIPLVPSIITAPKTSASRITSSPSLSPQHTPVSAPSTSPPPITETTPTNLTAEEPTPMPHESPLQSGRSLIEELDMDADISLVPLHDAEIQEKISDDTEVLLEEEETTELIEEPTELVEDQRSGEKGEQVGYNCDTTSHLNTASVPISTATETPEVSTAAESLVYIRRSAKKKKDKGKAIVIEDESVQKKSKKKVQEERLGYEEAVRLQEQINKEERKRIARDSEIAKQLQEEYDKARKKEVVTEVDIAHVIDWNDPSVIRTKEVSESVQEQTDEEPKTDELSQEQLNQMVIIVPDEVGNHTEVYQVFEDMLKNFDRDDLIKLWSLVQERYNSSGLTEDKEIELWVKLKMLFEPDAEIFLKLQKYMHDPLKWWLYDMCAVHHVSTEKGQDIFMLVEKYYPLTKGLATLMLSNKLRVDQQSEMADELLTKIYNIANKPRK
ncbi:hypothetical protein Tco_0820170 [Tanacetum coccineum]|uniref:Uncharacterized protein n=1 Tax=Tanacetum coccineum TaxID=301880 RepID=A0ABQ5A8Q0_9ASTR